MSVTPFIPDNDYCTLCGAIAAGPCATCRAMVCGDCCEVTGGSVKRVAVCTRCAAAGRGAVGWRAWAPILVPLVSLAFGLAVVVFLVRACAG